MRIATPTTNATVSRASFRSCVSIMDTNPVRSAYVHNVYVVYIVSLAEEVNGVNIFTGLTRVPNLDV